MISTSFWSADGKPVSAEEFLHNLFGDLPHFFNSEDEFRAIWSNPTTRKALLDQHRIKQANEDTDEIAELEKLK